MKNTTSGLSHENQDHEKLQGMKLYQAIEGIDDTFILQAEDANPVKKPFLQRRWGTLVACVLFLSVLSIPRVFSSSETPIKIPLANGVLLASLEECNVQMDGLKGLEETLRKYVTMPEKLNIANLYAEISPKGIVEDFDILLTSFDDTGKYNGMYRFEYNYSNKQMIYTLPDELEKSSQFAYLPKFYNENFDVDYVSEQQKRIPLTQQIALLDFNKYILSFASLYLNMGSDMPIIDADSNKDIPVLSLKDYRKGLGGTSNDEPGLYFRLYDGDSRGEEDTIIYKLPPLNPSTLSPSIGFTMKCDYRIDNNKMKVSRNDGNVPMINRVVGFTSDREGYVALGSSWSMGTGEMKFAYFTHDGGEHWTQAEMPENIFKAANEIGDIPIESVHKVDSLSYDEGVYTLICGKGSDNSINAKFQSRHLSGPWEFVEGFLVAVHTDG